MSDLFVAHTHPQDVVETPTHLTEAVSRPLVVITEQEVVFGTVAAALLPRTKPPRGVIGALRALFQSSAQEAQPEPRHYPPRRDPFLERAAMTRELLRL